MIWLTSGKIPRGWSEMLSESSPAAIELVQEFYTNIYELREGYLLTCL